MEIESKPEVKTRTVIDLDIRFPGETLELTLRPGDEEREDDAGDYLFVTYANGEKVSIQLAHVLHTSRRERQETVLPDKNAEAAPEA